MKSIGSDCKGARFAKFNYVLHGAAVSIGGLIVAAGFILGGQAPARPAKQQIAGNPDLERYLTLVATDKPIYRTGERLYVRGVVLRADDHSPMSSLQGSTGTAS